MKKVKFFYSRYLSFSVISFSLLFLIKIVSANNISFAYNPMYLEYSAIISSLLIILYSAFSGYILIVRLSMMIRNLKIEVSFRVENIDMIQNEYYFGQNFYDCNLRKKLCVTRC